MEEILESQTPEQEKPAMVEVVDIQFRPGQKVYYFSPNGKFVKPGDHLIIETARGPEYGIASAGNHMIPEKDVVQPLRGVIRFATEADERLLMEIRAKEKKAYNICQQKIGEHKLDMQLVSAEYAFDGSKILFFFTADERVDFRELVKNLASIFHTRIELRQIGVRDKAKMVGGLGICGRPFCCSQFLDDFQPVSIKMAKTQNLSLNPTKISGTCGRLMCCLKYEQDAYEDLIRSAPKAESFVDTPDGRGTVVDVNLLKQSVKVRMEDSPETIGCYQNCDICVLRSGKAKKSDPPIPADLAPISGSGKRVKKEVQEDTAFLEPVKFRYRNESVVDEKEHVPETQEEGKSASRRRKKVKVEKAQEVREPKEHPAQEKPRRQPKAEAAEAPAQEASAEGEGAKQSQRRRRSNYRRHRRPRPDGGTAE